MSFHRPNNCRKRGWWAESGGKDRADLGGLRAERWTWTPVDGPPLREIAIPEAVTIRQLADIVEQDPFRMLLDLVEQQIFPSVDTTRAFGVENSEDSEDSFEWPRLLELVVSFEDASRFLTRHGWAANRNGG